METDIDEILNDEVKDQLDVQVSTYVLTQRWKISS